jgi:hypothetical protein
MKVSSSAPSSTVARRLERLRALVSQRRLDDWGRIHIQDVLHQDAAAGHPTCPRYAGVLEESGDQCLILADSLEALAHEMSAKADCEIPLIPVESIDLDTGETRTACRNTSVSFIDPTPGS